VKRQRIEAAIKWHPDWSDRAIAKEAGCSHTTVAVIRSGKGWSGRKFGKAFWLKGWKL
jgi:hypothetical protein